MDRSLRTVDVERRGYGRRYTWLPVDAIDRTGFSIDFTGYYMQPERIDIRAGDIVRWEDGGRKIQAHVAGVEQQGSLLRVHFADAAPLPADYFNP